MHQPLNLRKKLLTAGSLVTLLPLLAVTATVLLHNWRMKAAIEEMSDQLVDRELRNAVRSAYALAESHRGVLQSGRRDAPSPDAGPTYLEDLQRSIQSMIIGETGFAFVLSSQGQYIVPPPMQRAAVNPAQMDGKSLEAIRSIIEKARPLEHEQIGEHVYLWSDGTRAEPRVKQARLMYLRPSDWIIVAAAYDDEVSRASMAVAALGRRSGLMLASVIAAAFIITLFAWLYISKDMAKPIEAANRNLESTVSQLEARTRQMRLLNELGDMLQACNSEGETFGVVVNICRRLFPEDAGCLCIFDASLKTLACVDHWGDSVDWPLSFPHVHCWAIRRGKPHVVANPEHEPVCEHAVLGFGSGYVCVPMVAQGEVLGMLHLIVRQARQGNNDEARRLMLDRSAAVMGNVLERYAPSLTSVRLRETLRLEAIRDPLTNLYNRRHMKESLRREFHRAHRRDIPISIIMLDIDHFKNLNDAHGHDAGDAILRKLARLLEENARQEDIVCRYGGEEFTVIMPWLGSEAAPKRAEELRRAIERRLSIDHQDKTLRATASIGVACYPEHGTTPEEVMEAADAALYLAKRQGRNRVELARQEGPLDDTKRPADLPKPDAA